MLTARTWAAVAALPRPKRDFHPNLLAAEDCRWAWLHGGPIALERFSARPRHAPHVNWDCGLGLHLTGNAWWGQCFALGIPGRTYQPGYLHVVHLSPLKLATARSKGHLSKLALDFALKQGLVTELDLQAAAEICCQQAPEDMIWFQAGLHGLLQGRYNETFGAVMEELANLAGGDRLAECFRGHLSDEGYQGIEYEGRDVCVFDPELALIAGWFDADAEFAQVMRERNAEDGLEPSPFTEEHVAALRGRFEAERARRLEIGAVQL